MSTMNCRAADSNDGRRRTREEGQSRKAIILYLCCLCYFSNVLHQFWFVINSATELVIPAAAKRRAGIQKWFYDYWCWIIRMPCESFIRTFSLILNICNPEDKDSQHQGVCCGPAPMHIREIAEAMGRKPTASRYSENMHKHFIYGDDESLPKHVTD